MSDKWSTKKHVRLLTGLALFFAAVSLYDIIRGGFDLVSTLLFVSFGSLALDGRKKRQQ